MAKAAKPRLKKVFDQQSCAGSDVAEFTANLYFSCNKARSFAERLAPEQLKVEIVAERDGALRAQQQGLVVEIRRWKKCRCFVGKGIRFSFQERRVGP